MSIMFTEVVFKDLRLKKQIAPVSRLLVRTLEKNRETLLAVKRSAGAVSRTKAYDNVVTARRSLERWRPVGEKYVPGRC